MVMATATSMGMRFKSDIKPSGRVKKVLFGEPDHAATREELVRQLDQISKADSQRWNYDFKKDKPLQGRFGWVRVNPLHLKCSVQSDATNHMSDVRANVDKATSDSELSAASSPSSSTSLTPSSSSNSPSESNSTAAKQTLIPEYFPKRKRSLSPLEEGKQSKRVRDSGERTPVARCLSHTFTPITE